MARKLMLVSVAYADGVVGVLRDRSRRAWLTDDVGRGGQTLLEDCRPSLQGTSDGRTLLGGLLPEGAVGAQVIDDAGARHVAAAGSGAWVIVLEQAPQGDVSPVCFVDGEGALVVPPLPGDWARSEVTDADDRCPACGALAWDEVHPTDASRGQGGPAGGEMTPTPIVVCRRCGHEESVGVWSSAEQIAADAQEVERHVREAEWQLRIEGCRALADAGFAIYAADGHAGQLESWGGGEQVTEVTVGAAGAHDRTGCALWVHTDADPLSHESEAVLARRALQAVLADDDACCPQRSPAAMTIWMQTREREHRRLAAAAEVRAGELRIEAVAQPFTIAERDGRWAAVGHRGELAVTVTARGVPIETVDLVAVRDALSLVGGSAG